jgi:4,4'-diaponeurosporenoate glycosyltransferase
VLPLFVTVAVGWLLGFLLVPIVSLPSVTDVPSSGDPPSVSVGELSVIIPARNEEVSLPQLLASIRRQHTAPLEVLVVDDGSTDRTAAIAREYNCTVIEAGPLPEGWLGKPHACWVGATEARGRQLLFLDADTTLAHDGLERLAEAHRLHGGLVSVQPYHRMERGYERLSAAFNLLLVAGLQTRSPFARTAVSRGGYGPCMLCSRADYFAVGGHRAVADTVLEDVALAQLMQRHGIPLNGYMGLGTVSFRMYPAGVRQLIDGWSKNMSAGVRTTPPIVVLGIVLWFAGAILSLRFIVEGVLLGFVHLAAVGLVGYGAYVAQLRALLSRLGNFGILTALLYPVHMLFFAGVFLRSIATAAAGGTVAWKGRRVRPRG